MRTRPLDLLALPGLALLGWISSCSSDSGEPPPTAGARPDVVLLTLDTTRADHLGCYGYEHDTSPALDAIASEGVRFEVAYAAAPVTLPSHTSLLTGLHPVHHGVRSNARYVLDDDARTLAEVLADAGYRTAAFLGAVVLERRYGLDQGFERFDDGFDESDREHAFATGRRPAAAVVDTALSWFAEAADGDAPLFLWLHFFDPHHPWSPPAELQGRFGTDERGLYDASIRAMDDQIGRLRREVGRRRGNVLWAAVSDHGEGLAEHGEETHGSFAYETTTRVVFLLAGAGLPRRPSPALARQVDLMPTLLSLLELQPPSGLDGRDLSAVLDEPGGPPAFVEARLGFEEYGWSPVYAIVEGGWKFVEAPRPQLFHLEEDPGEERDLVRAEPERVERMRERLARHLASGAESAGELEPDAGHLRELEALGYAGGGALRLEGEALPDPKDMIDVARDLALAKSKLIRGPGRDPAGAFALLESVIERNPANYDALSWLGREAWREAFENPEDPRRGEYAAMSSRAFAAMRERAPGLAEGHFGAGLNAILRGDADAAIGHYEAALTLDPDYVDALENLMRIRHSRSQWPAAVALAERLLALDPDHHDALQYGGLSHHRAGRHAEAIELLERLLPGRDEAERNGLRFVLGECHRLSGRPREALAHYAKVGEPDRTAMGVAKLEAACRQALAGG